MTERKVQVSREELDLGTVGPIEKPRQETGNSDIDKYRNIYIDPGDSYYSVRIAGAWVKIPPKNWFAGLFKRAKQVVVSSRAQVKGVPELAGVNGLNWVQDVKPGAGFSLGFRTMLVDYVPANGTSLSLDFEYTVIEESPITKFVKTIVPFINGSDQPLSGVLSMDPARLATVQAVGAIASRIMETLFPAETRLTALKFSGQWQLRDDLKSSYYFIVSAFHKQDLPVDASKLTVEPVGGADSGQAVLKSANGKDYRDNSYVIFEVSYLPALDDIFSPRWLDLYEQAKEYATDFVFFHPSPTDAERQEAWAECDGIIRQAKAFADEDKRYLESEKKKHYRLYRSKCLTLIWGKPPEPTDIDPGAKMSLEELIAEVKAFQEQLMASRAMRWSRLQE